MRKRRKSTNINNLDFIDTAVLNNTTYLDYMNRLEKICLSMFEWVNLPTSMDSIALEKSLFEFGTACLLYDNQYGFINTKCSIAGKLNIYGLPSRLQCYSYEYSTYRQLYTGFTNNSKIEECIFVMNNWNRIPTISTIQLFALRLYNAERTADVNINSQKTPIMLVCPEKQRFTLHQLYNKYNGNEPFIFGDKAQLDSTTLRSIDTKAPFVADKIMEYKKEIWNEALTFLRN